APFALKAALTSGLPDGDNAVILPVRQRPQQDAVHDAEDRGVGGDADGQHQHHDNRKTRLLRESANAGTQVTNKVFHRSFPPPIFIPERIPRVYFYRVERAPAREAARKLEGVRTLGTAGGRAACS